MFIKVRPIEELNEKIPYKLKIKLIEERDGKYGIFLIVRFDSNFGETSKIIGIEDIVTMNNFLSSLGYDMDSDISIDTNDLINKEVGGYLYFTPELYLKVRRLIHMDQVSDEFVYTDEHGHEVSDADIPVDLDDEIEF